jgi:hypothetical protein
MTEPTAQAHPNCEKCGRPLTLAETGVIGYVEQRVRGSARRYCGHCGPIPVMKLTAGDVVAELEMYG